MILSQSFYSRPTLKVAQDLLGCFLVRTPASNSLPTFFSREGGKLKNFLPESSPLLRTLGAGEGLGVRAKYKIVETEAYDGPFDLASHASRGQTNRNKVMFGPPGMIYVYFTYGMHYMLNIVTGPKNYPAAVLIRALEPVGVTCVRAIHELPRQINEFRRLTNGPARLTKALKIDKSFNGLPIFEKKYGLLIENRNEIIKPSQIIKTKRIGVNYAKNYKDKKWRFYLKNSPFVSKK